MGRGGSRGGWQRTWGRSTHGMICGCTTYDRRVRQTETCYRSVSRNEGNENMFLGNMFPFPSTLQFHSRKDENGKVFPGNMFPFPSILRAKKPAALGPPARIYIQGMTEMETCFQETCFRFNQYLVNGQKDDPTKLGRANLPAASRFARGQKIQIPYYSTHTLE